MRTIKKAKLMQISIQSIEIPEGSKFLDIKEMEDGIYLWIECDPNKKNEKVTILCFGTGGLILEKLIKGAKYIGTVPGAAECPDLHYYYKKTKTKSA